MANYQVMKRMKYEGKEYKPGDEIKLGEGMWDDLLVEKGMVKEVATQGSKQTRSDTRAKGKRVRRPKK